MELVQANAEGLSDRSEMNCFTNIQSSDLDMKQL